MTKKTKAEKQLRQREVLESLLNGTFNKHVLANKWHVLERTIRRDLEEIARNLGPFNDRLSILRKKALDVLGPRIKKMNDTNLIKLICTGVTQKIESTTEITKKVDVNVNIRALLAKYESVIERANNRNLQENNLRKQMDTTHTNTTTN